MGKSECLRCGGPYKIRNGVCLPCDQFPGYYNDHEVCSEICGDGLNLGINECDDGNKIDGDGCSSICQIEPGWKCVGGSPT
jgi:cysteine-rich repeat protein